MNPDATPSVKEILIVDDTPANLRLLASLLSGQGYSVRLAPSGKLALMSIQQNLPDLILLDIRMPQMDGYMICEQLKANERTCDIPIIFLSVLREGESKAKAFEVGGADYITKPFQPEEVMARVRHQLQLLDLKRQLKAQNHRLQQEVQHRKQVQAELRQERNLLRSLIDTIPDLIFFKNIEGQYLLWNQAFQEFTGRASQELLHRTDADLFSPRVAQRIQAQEQQVLSTRLPLRYEETVNFPNQQRRSLDTYKVPVQDATGGLLGFIGICRDVTDRKAAADYLNRTTSRLSALIRNLQAGILVEDENRRVALVNQSFCDLFGVNRHPSDLLGVHCQDLAQQHLSAFAEPEQAIARVEQILSLRQPVTAEALVLSDGRIFERDYIPITTGDRFQGHLWQYRDITSRKINEQALVQSTETLREFSNNLKQLHRLSIKQFATFQDLTEDYLKTGCQIMKFTGGIISTVEQETLTIQAVETTIEGIHPGTNYNLNDTFCVEAIRTQQTITQARFGVTPEANAHGFYKTFGFESFISTPIVVNGQIYGSLCFFSQEIREEGFRSHEKEIIELMAQSIGKYISSYRVEQQRQQAELALRESEARFRQLAEHIDNVFWVLEPSEQRFTYISPAYNTIWGYACEDVLLDPQSWRSAIHPNDIDRIVAKQREGQSYDEEYRIFRADGSMRWIRDRAFPICDEAGQIYRVVGIAEDITDIKHQEQSLRLIFEGTAAKTGSQFFRSLVRYLADVLQVRYALITQNVSQDTPRVKFLAFWQNGQFGDNYELDLEGTPCEKVLEGETVFHNNGVETLYPHFQVFADWDVCSYFGVPLLNANNQVVGHLAVLDNRPMWPEQTRELILKIFAARAGAELERQTFENEIQWARESADAANRAKSEFLANISHELRTPLNSILGFTQLILEEEEIDPQRHEYLRIVYRSGEHLLALINDVLEMSKIEAGKIVLATHPFDLHTLLRSLEEMFSLRAKAKNIALNLHVASNVPQYIETDESKLRQVLINLLNNAVKFTQQGHVCLNVRLVTKQSSEENPAVDTATIVSQSSPIVISFVVEDTGPGIAPEELQMLFEPFTQTSAGHSSREGTGLGLSISQRFVQLMGGMIQVQSELGQGSTFHFCLEALPVMDTPIQTVFSRTLNRVKHLAPGQPDYRILVAEDQHANRVLLVRILESAGFIVRTASDGCEAVAIAKAWRPHLIWMDIRMPDMDGYEATRQIKAARLLPHPVIIGLTANAFEEERNRVLASGCDHFVRKPFKVNQIFQTMAQYLPIQYVYAPETEGLFGDTHGVGYASEMSAEELSAALEGLLPSWIEAIRQAAIKGADEQILQLLSTLPSHKSALTKRLTYWAKNFQFNAILDILPPN